MRTDPGLPPTPDPSPTPDLSRTPRRRRLGVAVGIAVALAVAVAFGLTSPPAQRFLADPAGGPPQVGVDEVTVRADDRLNHAFDPPVIQVEAGTTVTWTFADVDEDGPVAHNVVGEGWGSPVQTTGTYEYTFEQPGSYPYTCTLHTAMDGRVEVVAP